MQFIITEQDRDVTVLAFLRRELSPSTKMLKYLKYREDGILVNGAHRTVRYRLQPGERLEVATEDTEKNEALLPVQLPLDVLYEDEDLVVPAKPADMPTHPSRDHHEDTVANALAFRYRHLGGAFVFRPINRLDRNTSGLLLIARNKLSAGKLTRALQSGEIKKTYLALLEGELEGESGRIDRCLHRTEQSIILREVCSPDAPDADPSLTEYRVLCRGNGYSLVMAHPITGRTHQLRVHFASIGHPILGDDLYGRESPVIPRHALHAYTLSFPHPTTGERLTLRAPLPSDMEQALLQLLPQGIDAIRAQEDKELL